MPVDFQRRLTHRIRRTLGPEIDRVARRFGQPTIRIRESEYAGTVHCRIDELESRLSEAGFSWDPVSLFHFTPLGTKADGSWVYRDSPLADRQLHAVLFAQAEDRVDVYGHYEYSWIRHPIKHALQQDIRREEGSRRMKGHLADIELPTARESVVRRKLAHLVELVRERLDGFRRPG